MEVVCTARAEINIDPIRDVRMYFSYQKPNTLCITAYGSTPEEARRAVELGKTSITVALAES